jgi:hypothetical protein
LGPFPFFNSFYARLEDVPLVKYVMEKQPSP